MDWLYQLDGALKLQNFRRVAHETLSEVGSIDLSGEVPPDLDKALEGLQDVNDWTRIGQQLALLKRLSDFRGIYVRADRHVAKLAVICETRGTPATAEHYRPSFNFSWECDRSLEPHLRNYELSPELVELINQLIEKYGGSNAELIKKAVGWLRVALQINASSGGPNGAFVGVSASSVDQDLRSRLDGLLWGSEFRKKAGGFMIHPPTMEGLAWELPSNSLLGRANAALSKEALEHGLQA